MTCLAFSERQSLVLPGLLAMLAWSVSESTDPVSLGLPVCRLPWDLMLVLPVSLVCLNIQGRRPLFGLDYLYDLLGVFWKTSTCFAWITCLIDLSTSSTYFVWIACLRITARSYACLACITCHLESTAAGACLAWFTSISHKSDFYGRSSYFVWIACLITIFVNRAYHLWIACLLFTLKSDTYFCIYHLSVYSPRYDV